MVTTAFTTDVITTEPTFHPEPWVDPPPPGWLMRYNLMMALEVDVAKAGDVVQAHSFLTINARSLKDVRPQNKGRDVGCQVTMHCRVATAMPSKTVLDLPPKETDQLGKWLGGVPSSGEDCCPEGTFNNISAPKLMVKVGRVYYQPLRTWNFTVLESPCFLLVWLALKSAGCNGKSKVAAPDSSSYALLTYVCHHN